MKICVILTVCLLKCALEGTAIPTPDEGENEEADENNDENQEEESPDEDENEGGEGGGDEEGNEEEATEPGSTESTNNVEETAKTGDEATTPETPPPPQDNQPVELILITTVAPPTPEESQGNTVVPPDSQNAGGITSPQSNPESVNERPVSKDSVVTTPRQITTKQPVPHIRPTLVSTTLPSIGPESADESPLKQQSVTLSQSGQRAEPQESVTKAPIPAATTSKPAAPQPGPGPKNKPPQKLMPAQAPGGVQNKPTTHRDTSFREMEFSFREWTAQMKSDTADDKASVNQIKATARPQYAAQAMKESAKKEDDDDDLMPKRPDASARTAGSSVRATASLSPIRGGSAVRAGGSMLKQSTLPTRTGQSSVRTAGGIISKSDAPPVRNYQPGVTQRQTSASLRTSVPSAPPAPPPAPPTPIESNPNKATDGLGSAIHASVPNVDAKITEEIAPSPTTKAPAAFIVTKAPSAGLSSFTGTKAPSAGLSSLTGTKAPAQVPKTLPTTTAKPPSPSSTPKPIIPTTRAPAINTRPPSGTSTRAPVPKRKATKQPLKTTEAPPKAESKEEQFELPPLTMQAPSAVPSSHHKRRKTTVAPASIIPPGLPNKPVVSPTQPPSPSVKSAKQSSLTKSAFGKTHSSIRSNSGSIFGPGGINSFFKDSPSKRGGVSGSDMALSPSESSQLESVPPPIETVTQPTTTAAPIKAGKGTSQGTLKGTGGAPKAQGGTSKTTTAAPKAVAGTGKGVTGQSKNKTAGG